MEAKVIRWGDDLAVRLSSAEAEELGIREGETVEIVSKRPVPPEPQQWTGRRYVNGLPVYTLEDMVAEMRRLGPDFEPPTVDWGPDVGSEIIDDDDSR
ncbi:AbrB/MazE/SpoVT family DNA-binding domain-containing protein [Methylobacterium fujisawaense]|uniref:AbrB/MazE/SpoVT family DNA-binding domain-containing protein n=1 Tax=Methylobacterium fujisawaense TaxID=107400 RepID=UPI00244C8B33|nr:MazF family transcriptional regulator [Methylobacterium fujisawaense]MDH3028439.1 MazF family transcriptional regulator [Methylobacterium fujisawaense]